MNPVLDQTRAAIMQSMDPRFAPIVEKMESTGQELLFSEQMRPMLMEQLQGGAEPQAIGSGVAQLAGILYGQAAQESQGTFPPEAIVYVSQLLLLDALAALEEAGVVQVTPDFLAQCTEALGSTFLQLMGVTPEKLQELASQQGQQGQPSMGQQEPTAASGGIVAGAMGGA